MKQLLESLKPCFQNLSRTYEIQESMECIRESISKAYNLENIIKVGIECNDNCIDKLIYFRYVEANKVIMLINNRILLSGLLTPEEMAMLTIHEVYFTLSRAMKVMYTDEYLRVGHPKVCPTHAEYREVGNMENTVGYTAMSLYKTRTDLLSDNGVNISYRDVTNNEFVYDADDLLEIYEEAVSKLVLEGYGEIFMYKDAIQKIRQRIISTLQEFMTQFNLESIDASNMKLLDILNAEYNATSVKYIKDFLRPAVNSLSSEKSNFTNMLQQHLQRNEEEFVKIHEASYYTLVSDNKYNEIQKVLDEMELDLQNIESTDDKYNLLDKIHRHLKLNDKIKRELKSKINNGKANVSELEIYEDFDVKLNQLRGRCIEVKIKPKRYGIFAQYPEGYEG